MNYLKNHLTLILALISIMISIFFYQTFLQIFNKYKKNIIDNYSIVIVSEKPIQDIKFDKIKKVIPINISKNIKEIQKKYKNIDFKGIRLPYFYKLKLKTLLSPEELTSLTQNLKRLPFIKRVMTKSSSQTKIYNLLTLLEIVSKTFMGLISIIGFLLILKQLEVWKLEHSERMYIMELFGAPFWFKGAALFKIAFIDALISIILSMITIAFIINSYLFRQIINDLGISFEFNYFSEFLLLFLIGIIIAISSSIVVVTGKK